MKINKEKFSKPLIIALILVLVAVIAVFTLKFYGKYKASNTFDFAESSPEGYFTDLATSVPEE